MFIAYTIPTWSYNQTRPPPPPHTRRQVTSSLSFFLFSFQVHEKSILLACLPMSLLTAHHPFLATTFQLTAAFSMYPLLTQDQLCLAVWALCCLYSLLSVLFLDRTNMEMPLMESKVKVLVSEYICLYRNTSSVLMEIQCFQLFAIFHNSPMHLIYVCDDCKKILWLVQWNLC